MTLALDRAQILRGSPWRESIVAQIINCDIDGLLTAALMYEERQWPVVGLYDTQHLWLAHEWVGRLRDDYEKVLWVDVDMCWPGSRSLSQHVILRDPGDAMVVDAYQRTLNPSLAAGHAVHGNYADKYPFGTFQWAWWLVNRRPPDIGNQVQTGLVWMPDGGFRSIVDPRYRENCLDWALRRLPGNPLAPLTAAGRDRKAEEFVAAAEAYLHRTSGVRTNWRNHQWVPTRATGWAQQGSIAVLDDPASGPGRGHYDSLLSAIARAFSWRAAHIPSRLQRFEGGWRKSPDFPPGWPSAAEHKKVVSLAATGFRQVCYTLPQDMGGGGGLSGVLP